WANPRIVGAHSPENADSADGLSVEFSSSVTRVVTTDGLLGFQRRGPLRSRDQPSRARGSALVPAPDVGDATATMDDRAADPTPDTGQDTAAASLSARAAAAALGVNERTIRRAIARGELAAVKRSGVSRIPPADLA